MINIIVCTVVGDPDVNLIRGPLVGAAGTVLVVVLDITALAAIVYGISASGVLGSDAFGTNVDTYVYVLNIT